MCLGPEEQSLEARVGAGPHLRGGSHRGRSMVAAARRGRHMLMSFDRSTGAAHPLTGAVIAPAIDVAAQGLTPADFVAETDCIDRSLHLRSRLARPFVGLGAAGAAKIHVAVHCQRAVGKAPAAGIPCDVVVEVGRRFGVGGGVGLFFDGRFGLAVPGTRGSVVTEDCDRRRGLARLGLFKAPAAFFLASQDRQSDQHRDSRDD